MKETIYTIPINEAFELRDGTCPVCRLREGLERDALDYVMGASMMEPDVRQETNRKGFCKHHLTSMMTMGNRLSLALMLESYLLEQAEHVKRYDPDACFVCERLDGFMEAYIRNIYHIFENDGAFSEKMRNSRLCYPHIGRLLEGIDKNMKRKPADDLRKTLIGMAEERFAELIPLVSAFCKSFDHRFADLPLGDAKTAVEQTAAWLRP
ncbi:hypothetical protein FACS18949_04960 [Clostridia bacterium]|nr:hypothetical protein FACS189425_03840 [Clostridia bacterium]GHV32809.1 hypothetical protein FACS18949_04960 [Clostridia bacterium]